MTDSAPEDPPVVDAVAIYGEFRRRKEEGEDLAFETLCDEHPRLANALRALHSLEGSADANPATDSLEGAVVELRAAETDLGVTGDGPDRFRAGQVIGPYRILDVLGEGGFAVVYRAEQTEPVRRLVALKAIKPGLDTKHVLVRFEAERQALALMSHTSIAKVYDAGATADSPLGRVGGGRPFFVMEYVEGQPLSEYCDAKRMSTDERLDLFLHVCDAIQHAHQKGIIHRDLKPANVLVTSEGERPVPKVIDFGIAKALGGDLTDSTLKTQDGQVIGTPAYMSPEQAEGELERVDTRTDIYALGVILYELLAGRRPFDFSDVCAGGIREIQRILREVDPPRPSTRVAGSGERTSSLAKNRETTPTALARRLRGDLDWITMKAMAKDPAERYQSASELAEDVRRHERAEPVLAGPPSVLYRLRKLARRHRQLLKTAAVVAIAVGVAGWMAAYLKERARYRESIVESVQLLGEAEETIGVADALVRELEAQRGQLLYQQSKEQRWWPIWSTKLPGIKARIAELEREVGSTYGKVYRTLTLAHDTAPPDTAARSRAFASLARLRAGLDDSPARIPVGSLLSHEPGFEGVDDDVTIATLSIRSNPPGAEAYLFRYEEVEGRQLPRPFGVGSSGTGDLPPLSGLDVERVWDPELVMAKDEKDAAFPFIAGDRWLDIDGTSITSFVRLAGALRGLEAGTSVSLTIERDGARHRVRWVPYPRRRYALDGVNQEGRLPVKTPLKPGQLVDTRLQLGITFDVYPLEFSARSLIGQTSAEKPLPVDLSRGSYLLVCRRVGHVDVRYPIVASDDVEVDVELPRVDSAPQGFVFIPGSSFRHGGNDPDLLQNIQYGETFVESFWIDRLEVSLGEYLEFFRERSDQLGKCVPKSPAVAQIFRELQEDMEPILILPIVGKEEAERYPLIEPGEDEWKITPRATPDSPVQGLSYVAVLEYVHWLSERTAGWKFAIAKDLQWEKAARGTDWRRFVWGDHLTWSLCWSQPGVYFRLRGFPTCRAAYPFDESVYGVRDMTGSVPEFTIEKTRSHMTFRAVRGGGWGKYEEYRFRTDARVGLPPLSTNSSSGIRLVATPERSGR